MSRLLLCAALCVGASATTNQAGGFVRALEFKHRLRVCNAYPLAAALDVFRGSSEKLTSDAPMQYKTCKDFHAPLNTGDKLEFKIGEASAGTFAVSDLPSNDAVLLLVIHRHDTTSTAVSFDSHVFANLQNSQVVVMDAYKGAAQSSVKIMEKSVKGKASVSEDLRYASVVAVNPGEYDVELVDSDGKANSKTNFVAAKGESYVIMRTGVEAKQGRAFPQELLIYPNSPHSAAALTQASLGVLALMLGITQW